VGHLNGFLGDGSHTSQIGLIALVLQYSLLPQLDSVLLLKFFNKRLEELVFVLLLFNGRLHFDRDLLLHSTSVHLVASNLSEQLPVTDGTELDTSIIEFFDELLTALLTGSFSGHLSPLLENSPAPPVGLPLVKVVSVDGVVFVSLKSSYKLNKEYLPGVQAV
jgi:hypothetical protein